jgi:hypothetical protein
MTSGDEGVRATEPDRTPRPGPIGWIIVAVAFLAIAPLLLVLAIIGLCYQGWHRIHGRKPPPPGGPPGPMTKLFSIGVTMVAVTVMALAVTVEWVVFLPFRLVGRRKIGSPWEGVGMVVVSVQQARKSWNDWPTSRKDDKSSSTAAAE